jgi:hypothetical protein
VAVDVTNALDGQFLLLAQVASGDKPDRHLLSTRIDGDEWNRGVTSSQGQIRFELEPSVSRKAGRVQATTEIIAYVLGATLEEGLEVADYGENTHIIPIVYQTVLRKAHQRTFNLQKRLQETQPTSVADPDVEEVLRVDSQRDLFENAVPKPHMPSPDETATTPRSTAKAGDTKSPSLDASGDGQPLSS